MNPPVPQAVDTPQGDEPALAEATSVDLRLVVREPIPAPRWPSGRPRPRASRPDRPAPTRRVAASDAPAADRRARALAPAARPVTPAVLLARMTAIGALVLFFATATAFLVAGSRPQPLPPADMHGFEQRLAGYDHDVRASLAQLGPRGSVARARLRTREALAATELLARQLRDFGGPAAVRLRAATPAQLRYLDAVGSTLTNPRSPLRSQLSARARAARTALAALDRPAAPARPR